MYLKALELASSEDKKILNNFYQSKLKDSNEKITLVKKVFDRYQIPTYMKAQITNYSQKAFVVLEDINISEGAKKGLLEFGKALMTRNV